MGNPTFGTRQPCCRFSFPRCLSRCSNNRRRSFQNQSLTKCKFCKSLVLKFIQNGGCRGDWFVCVEPVMLEHTSTSNTLYFLYLAHSLARRRLAKPSLFSCLRTLFITTGVCTLLLSKNPASDGGIVRGGDGKGGGCCGE